MRSILFTFLITIFSNTAWSEVEIVDVFSHPDRPGTLVFLREKGNYGDFRILMSLNPDLKQLYELPVEVQGARLGGGHLPEYRYRLEDTHGRIDFYIVPEEGAFLVGPKNQKLSIPSAEKNKSHSYFAQLKNRLNSMPLEGRPWPGDLDLFKVMSSQPVVNEGDFPPPGNGLIKAAYVNSQGITVIIFNRSSIDFSYLIGSDKFELTAIGNLSMGTFYELPFKGMSQDSLGPRFQAEEVFYWTMPLEGEPKKKLKIRYDNLHLKISEGRSEVQQLDLGITHDLVEEFRRMEDSDVSQLEMQLIDGDKSVQPLDRSIRKPLHLLREPSKDIYIYIDRSHYSLDINFWKVRLRKNGQWLQVKLKEPPRYLMDGGSIHVTFTDGTELFIPNEMGGAVLPSYLKNYLPRLENDPEYIANPVPVLLPPQIRERVDLIPIEINEETLTAVGLPASEFSGPRCSSLISGIKGHYP